MFVSKNCIIITESIFIIFSKQTRSKRRMFFPMLIFMYYLLSLSNNNRIVNLTEFIFPFYFLLYVKNQHCVHIGCPICKEQDKNLLGAKIVPRLSRNVFYNSNITIK